MMKLKIWWCLFELCLCIYADDVWDVWKNCKDVEVAAAATEEEEEEEEDEDECKQEKEKNSKQQQQQLFRIVNMKIWKHSNAKWW